MYIKHLIGGHVGDIEDLPFTIARDKVLRGEAQDVYNQLVTETPAKANDAVIQPEVLSTRVDAVSVGVKAQRKKR